MFFVKSDVLQISHRWGYAISAVCECTQQSTINYIVYCRNMCINNEGNVQGTQLFRDYQQVHYYYYYYYYYYL